MNSVCDNCALRLYNTKSHHLSGIGNPWFGNCIVVPNVDYNAYKAKSMSFSSQVQIINDILYSTGELDSNYYVVPLIRCNEAISCDIDNETYKKCITWFAKDIKTYQFKNILLLGSAARRFLNINVEDNLNMQFVSQNNRKYYVNYSPLIKYVDEEKYEVFKQQLIKWYNAVTSGIYDYELKLI